MKISVACVLLSMLTMPAWAQSNPDIASNDPGSRVNFVDGLPSSAGGSTLSVVQSGIGNQSTMTSSSQGNSLQQTQLGNGNSAQATQQGALNSLTLTQIGNNNPMAATQIGVGNSLTAQQYGNNTTGLGITQYGGAHATVTQSR